MTTTWVQLPVPEIDRDYLQQVIADRQRRRGEPEAPSLTELHTLTGSADTVKAIALAKQPVWPATAFQQLLDDPTDTAKRFVKAIYVLDEDPGNLWLSTDEVAERTGMTIGEWRSACRTIRKLLERNYPDVPRWTYGGYEGEASWPLADASGRHIGGKDQVYVAISEAQSKVWRSVVGTSSI